MQDHLTENMTSTLISTYSSHIPVTFLSHTSLDDTILHQLPHNFQMNVWPGGEERVGESPYTVRVLPQHPVTCKCTVTGPGRSHATAGEPAEFYFDGRDQYSNRYPLLYVKHASPCTWSMLYYTVQQILHCLLQLLVHAEIDGYLLTFTAIK